MQFPKMPSSRRSRRAKKNGPQVYIFLLLLGGVGSFFQLKWMTTGIVTEEAEKVMSAKVPCHHCDGAGQLRSSEDFQEFYPCSICYGVGFRNVWTRPGLREFCPECIGMGTIINDELVPVRCTRCEGWGTIAKSLDDIRIRDLDDPPDSIPSGDHRLIAPPSTISPESGLTP